MPLGPEQRYDLPSLQNISFVHPFMSLLKLFSLLGMSISVLHVQFRCEFH